MVLSAPAMNGSTISNHQRFNIVEFETSGVLTTVKSSSDLNLKPYVHWMSSRLPPVVVVAYPPGQTRSIKLLTLKKSKARRGLV
ncbi:hypothetical protein TNCV_3678151 [Trichonephila clavipes]|nr:hypothetical protein TNCV_3678151 [Trichonephila clavipes]